MGRCYLEPNSGHISSGHYLVPIDHLKWPLAIAATFKWPLFKLDKKKKIISIVAANDI
jgi:hypothetical protein